MKNTLFILCLLCLATSCRKDVHVVCRCIGNPQTGTFDLGYQKSPSAAANQATCDSDGVHAGFDTCIVTNEKQ